MNESALNPLWYRAINLAYRSAGAVGVARHIDVDKLLVRNTRHMRREFDDLSFQEGLRALVTAANTEANLNGFGRVMLTALINRYLRQRLQLENWRDSHPEVRSQVIKRPVIIAGLPRTGTTFLHQLLACDQQFRAPRTFEIDDPVPPPLENMAEENARIRKIQRGIDVIHRIVPHFQAIHPLGALLPDECQQITAYQFSSIAFQHIMHSPSFQRWLLQHDFSEDLAFHRRFLQHLQSGWSRAHWLLKSPAHIQYLPSLLATYPDAMIIHTHRNPAEVMASTASLSWNMQSVFSAEVSQLQVGGAQLEFFREMLSQCLQDRASMGETPSLFDVRYEHLVADPMAVVMSIYAHYQLELGQQARLNMQQFLATNKQNQYGLHHYSAVDYGLTDLSTICEFSQYRERFGV